MSGGVRWLLLPTVVLLAASAAPADTLYVSDFAQNLIYKIGPDGSVSTFASTGMQNPQGLAFDRQGNLFVANSGNNTISKITPSGDVSTFISTGLDYPSGLAFDIKGNLYVSNELGNTIKKITPGGTETTFDTAKLSEPTSLAFDLFGNLFVGNNGSGNFTVAKITPSGVASSLGPLLPRFTDLAFDGNGNLYGLATGSDTVDSITLTPTVQFSPYLQYNDSLDYFIFDSTGKFDVITQEASIYQTVPGGTPVLIAANLVDPGGIADSSVTLPIPEPTGMILLGGAAAPALLRRRR